ncbi:hypothetical protein EYF80_007651 [Liparis tanakae]|uniref:Uncharacterized protein n=1 Tax=Liparis tanakae TaxID=230148 RepID=A0A4Z2IVM1_9TELE|nr:hypothetical protein EYF80_007651 [Liparis tanakae]
MHAVMLEGAQLKATTASAYAESCRWETYQREYSSPGEEGPDSGHETEMCRKKEDVERSKRPTLMIILTCNSQPATHLLIILNGKLNSVIIIE